MAFAGFGFISERTATFAALGGLDLLLLGFDRSVARHFRMNLLYRAAMSFIRSTSFRHSA
jgi:hypothetical protein